MKRTRGNIKNKNSLELVVLALDPSLTGFGWAVIKQNKIIDTGCIKTIPEFKKRKIYKATDRMRRVHIINRILKRAIEKHNINYIVTELPHGSQSAIAAISLGMVSSMPQTIADFLGFKIEHYSEGESKKALLGKRSAEKIETIYAIDKLFDVPITKGIKKDKKDKVIALWSGIAYKDEAVADAISVYYAALKNKKNINKFN